MKKIAIIACLMFANWCVAQQQKAINYINTYKDIAIAEMQRSGVPASITLAQGILESSYGESDLCKGSNNHFGIKCKTEWTGEKVYHDDDTRNECFRSYPSAADSYKDHSDFLKSRAHYNFLFSIDPLDYESWAKGLKKAGYATEKDYPVKLIKVINDYNLNQYSVLALNKLPETNSMAAVTPNINMKDTTLDELVITVSPKKLLPRQQVQVATVEEADSVIFMNSPVATTAKANAINHNYPEGIFTVNHSKVVFAKEGTSLLALARQYDITLAKLLDFNDMVDEDVLSADKLIFIEKKLPKGAVDFHIALPQETLHDICQTEGVRLDKIFEYNNLKKAITLKEGQKILLRPVVPSGAAKTATAAVAQPSNSTHN